MARSPAAIVASRSLSFTRSSPAPETLVTPRAWVATISSAGAATALSETAWSCPPTTCGEISEQGGGSGGGLSDIFKQGDQWKDDLSWQTGPGVRNAYSNGARQVPHPWTRTTAIHSEPG